MGDRGAGFGGLHSWPGTLFSVKSVSWGLLVGAPCQNSVVCEAMGNLARSAIYRACGFNILAICDQQSPWSVRLHVSISTTWEDCEI